MKLFEITEAPVTDIEVFGDIKKEPGSFDSSVNDGKDRGNIELLTRPSWLNRVVHTLRKTPWDFRIYFAAGPLNKSIGTYANILTPEEFVNRITRSQHHKLEKAEQRASDIITKGADNTITIIFTHNITGGDNYKPMTGWITMHRLFHIISWDPREKEFIKIEDIMRSLDNITRDLYNKPLYTANAGDPISSAPNVLQDILTMASARGKRLGFPSDIYCEIGAQYVVTGSIKFNPLPETYQGVTPHPMKLAAANKELQALARNWGDLFHKEMDNLVGKVCHF